jgi:hypothetical protein
MSFDLTQLLKLRQAGGAVWQRYEELQAQADASAHGSPAQAELGTFRAVWLEDCNRAAEVARELFAARAAAAELAARSA